MRMIATALVLAAATATLDASPASARSCFKKAAVGNALTEDLAKFQVDAALLQATDWAIYATYVTSGTTPGYTFGPRTYKCSAQTVGYQCIGSATLCKE